MFHAAWVRCEVAPHIAPGDPSTSHHSTDAVLTVKTLNIFIYTTYPQSLIVSRIYRLGENRRFITPTLHDFSWRYFSYIYNRDISGHPVLYDHYVSMPPAPPCSDMTLDDTLPPLHYCPPSVTGKSRIIRWESESQWSESEVDIIKCLSCPPRPLSVEIQFLILR